MHVEEPDMKIAKNSRRNLLTLAVFAYNAGSNTSACPVAQAVWAWHRPKASPTKAATFP